MATFRNPVAGLRHTFLPINRNAGDFGKEIIATNTNIRKIRFLELTTQLTQFPKTHAFAPRTREHSFRDLTVLAPRIVGRIEKSKSQYQTKKYYEPRI